jgi:hypothetical protein
MTSWDKTALKTITYWVKEREAIRRARAVGKPWPWSKDPLFQKYRWCNVRRMDDKVSQWLDQHWYIRGSSLKHTMTAATVARLVNWPESMALLTPFKRWDQFKFLKVMHTHKSGGGKVFTGAYIINGASGGNKIDQVCTAISAVNSIKPGRWSTQSMEANWLELQTVMGIGSFIAGQIVADVRWVYDAPWNDRMEWAPLGPGSARGMRRMLGLPAEGPLKQGAFNELLPQLWDKLMGVQEVSEIFEERACEAMDLQNCLCEFDKYMRLKYENGHVRNGYRPPVEAAC